jgi:hypothetical protein
MAKSAEQLRAMTAPRIYEIEPRERAARPPIMVRAAHEEDAEPEEVPAPVPTARPAFRMAPGTTRRPFGGRALTKENMDVPAFMRKQMD